MSNLKYIQYIQLHSERMLGLLVFNSSGDFGCKPMSLWSSGGSACEAVCAGSAGRSARMMRMQRRIIGCLMAADHVSTMTRAPQGDQRDRGENGRHPG